MSCFPLKLLKTCFFNKESNEHVFVSKGFVLMVVGVIVGSGHMCKIKHLPLMHIVWLNYKDQQYSHEIRSTFEDILIDIS